MCRMFWRMYPDYTIGESTLARQAKQMFFRGALSGRGGCEGTVFIQTLVFVQNFNVRVGT